MHEHPDKQHVPRPAFQHPLALGVTAAGPGITLDSNAFSNAWSHVTSNQLPAGTVQLNWTQNTAGSYCSTSAVPEEYQCR